MSNTPKFIHIAKCDKFIPPYIDFINERFISDEHFFFLKKGMSDTELKDHKNIKIRKPSVLGAARHYISIIKSMCHAKKVIIHSLLDKKMILILFFMPRILPKCYWVLWGHDLYVYQSTAKKYRWKFWEIFRRRVIRNMGYITTTVPGDYHLAKKWYGTNAKFIHNLMYTSHISRGSMMHNDKSSSKENICIQVGNSADPNNNHIEVLTMLDKLHDLNFNVFCPLSYGNEKYAKEVIKVGRDLFSDRFYPVTDFVSFNQYNKFIASIDIAIFNFKRQQGMGNIIGLLSLGKKVYLRSDTTPYEYFSRLGLFIGKTEDLSYPDDLSQEEKKKNMEIMNKHFTTEELYKDWAVVFDE